MLREQYLATTLAIVSVGASVCLSLWLWNKNKKLELELQRLGGSPRTSKVSFAELEGTSGSRNSPRDRRASYPSAGTPDPSPTGKPRIIYLDGCFDMLHYGHANALRQARACGDVLLVGLVADDDIILNKGSPPVMCEEERYAALAACKFVDKVIRNAPYDLDKNWVDTLVREYNVTYIIHGDDPCLTADGQDAYAYAKQIGVFKQIKRTEGVSTTDIVGRMLLMTKEHHVPPPRATPEEDESGDGDGRISPSGSVRSVRSSQLARFEKEEGGEGEGAGGGRGEDMEEDSSEETNSEETSGKRRKARLRALLSQLPSTHSRFLPTARRIMQFAEGRVPGPDDKVVYMQGSWDIFNPGHIAALAAAKSLGSFVLVGIYDDPTINKLKGHGLPILNLYERTLSLLSCKYVDEVIIGVPWVITEELIKNMNIQCVVRGTTCDLTDAVGHARLGLQYDALIASDAREEAYAVPSSKGLLVTIPSPKTLTALDIVSRILAQRETYQVRYEKKAANEESYNKNKTYVKEE